MLFGGITIPGHPDPENIRKLDLLPIPQIRRMMRMGIAIDREWLWELSLKLDSRKTELKQDICSLIPEEALETFVSSSTDELSLNVESASQIATLLFQVLRVGTGRRLKTTKNGQRLSTGKKQLETLKRDHPVIPLILEYRECSKLKSTYTDALPRLAKRHSRGTSCPICGMKHLEDHYRIHTEILTTRTDTGRLASKSPNLQNIPARTKLGREVRKAFIPQKGCKLVGYDYAQIELRLLAHAAREANMLRIFNNDGDIHLDTAMRAFDIADPKAVDKMLHRAPCKNVNFGVAYGLGETGLYDLMAVTYAVAGVPLPDWLDVAWCKSFIDKWFDLYPQAAEYFDLQHYRARRYGITWCMFGGVRRIPEVRSVHERVRQAGLRQGGNNPIQRGAAGVFKLGMARAEEVFSRLRQDSNLHAEALLPIHDELLSEVDEKWAEEVGAMYGYEMEEALRDEESGEYCCRVPVKTDGKAMKRWEKE
jgi:DNA polymerase-1